MGLFTTGKKCWSCSGTGKSFDRDHRIIEGESCRSCYGTGDTFSDVGNELIELLREHFDLRVKTEADAVGQG